MQEGGPVQADVHERGLHAWQHSGHSPLVEIAHEAAPAGAFDVDLLEDVAFHDRCAGFAGSYVDENFDRHRRPPCQHGTSAARSSSAVSNNGSPITPE